MKTTTAKDLLRGLCEAGEQPITAVVTDSRQVQPGCVFVCFPGQRVDGHNYAVAAAQSGAAYVVVNHPVEGLSPEKMVLCADSYRAMMQMAQNYREQFAPIMIGVTGSVGKTTTKEFCYAVLAAFGKTLKTEGNQNNELGVPGTLLRLTDSDEFAVVEMGMSHLGEIDRLVRVARPSAGIITCIGVSHMENLGSRENILKAKLEICDGLPEGAPLVLNADDELLPTAILPAHVTPCWFGIRAPQADVRAEQIEQTASGQSFVIQDARFGCFSAEIPALGEHNIYNALAAYTAATRLGVDAARAAKALSDYQTTGMRQHIVQKNDVTVVEDCYNASPDSMRASLAMFAELPANNHIAVLGDMLELGAISEREHRRVGELCAKHGIDLLVAYGKESLAMADRAKKCGVRVLWCDNAAQAAKFLRENVHSGDALLVKASHGMALENVLRQFYAEEGEH